MHLRPVLALAVLLLAACLVTRTTAVRAQDADEPTPRNSALFEPGDTWVLIVGLLEWQDGDAFGSFPKEDRRDRWLADHFRDAGVPDERVIMLEDAAATKAAVQAEMERITDGADDNDTLVFYFAGHGAKARKQGWFVPYDAKASAIPGTCLSVAGLINTIDTSFPGPRAILAADCCYSGNLTSEASADGRTKSYLAYSSAMSNEVSTGAWTFTDCLLQGLRGDGEVDLDRDGTITAGELGLHMESEMSFFEEQYSTTAVTGTWSDASAIATVGTQLPAAVGRNVEVEYDGNWYKAEIIDAKESADGAAIEAPFKVAYVGYDASWDEWVSAERLRDYEPPGFDAGTAVEVRWKRVWYDAVVIETRNGLHYIQYDGYDESWNEWVGPDRIRAKD